MVHLVASWTITYLIARNHEDLIQPRYTKFEAFVLSSAHNEEVHVSTQPILLSEKEKKKKSILSGLTIQGRNLLAQWCDSLGLKNRNDFADRPGLCYDPIQTVFSEQARESTGFNASFVKKVPKSPIFKNNCKQYNLNCLLSLLMVAPWQHYC